MNNKSTYKTKKAVLTALVSAVAFLCMFVFKFNVGFLTFDFKNTIIALGAMILGPVSAVISSLIVALLEMITVSGTGIYGMIMNFLSAATFSVTAALIYQKKRTMSGAIIAFLFATLSMTAVMIIFNLVVTPAYMGVPINAVVEMIPTLLLPFNLIKSIICSALTLILYKPFCSVLGKSGFGTSVHGFKMNKTTIYVLAGSIIVIVLCVIAFLFLLDGSVSLFS